MSIVINQNIVIAPARGATTSVVLQPGTVISAKVTQILGNDQVRIAVGSQSIDAQSQLALQVGQTLQLAVSQTADGVRLAVVNPGVDASASQGPGGVGGAAASLDQVTLTPSATVNTVASTAAAAAAPTIQLTPAEALAVSTAAQTAATQQTSLAPLFANLGVAAGLGNLPPPVQQAVAQLLAQRTSLDQNLSAADVKQAFSGSGLFLEAHLASGSPPSAAAPDLKAALIVLRQVLTTSLQGSSATPDATMPQSTATPPQGPTPPTVALPPNATPVLVVVLEQGAQPVITAASLNVTTAPEAPITLSPALSPGIAAPDTPVQGAVPPIPDVLDFGAAGQVVLAPSTAADAAARAADNTAALGLLQETLQAAAPFTANAAGLTFDDSLLFSLLPAVTGTRTQRVDDAAFPRSSLPPPPINGALPAAQAVMPATLVSNSPAETAMHHLLADTDGAIARQTLLQVASLPDRVDATVAQQDPHAPRWNFEIPFATPQGTAMAQFEISRDGGGNEVAAAKRVWRARFSLDVEPAGPVHALISLVGDKTSVRMWAERSATAAQLRAGVSQLSQALSRAELQPGDIVIQDGAPIQPAPAAAGHFLDRAL
jgi:hypothetical protein